MYNIISKLLITTKSNEILWTFLVHWSCTGPVTGLLYWRLWNKLKSFRTFWLLETNVTKQMKFIWNLQRINNNNQLDFQLLDNISKLKFYKFVMLWQVKMAYINSIYSKCFNQSKPQSMSLPVWLINYESWAISVANRKLFSIKHFAELSIWNEPLTFQSIAPKNLCRTFYRYRFSLRKCSRNISNISILILIANFISLIIEIGLSFLNILVENIKN